MKKVYVLTNSIELYSDIGIFGFFAKLQNSRNISVEELKNSIPNRNNIMVYFTRHSAESAAAKQRVMSLVEDNNLHNIKGFTYRSYKTPIILRIELNNELKENPNEVQRLIRKSEINFNMPASIINIEKDYKGTMPESIYLQ